MQPLGPLPPSSGDADAARARSEAKRLEGNALLDRGQLDLAAACYRQALAFDAGSVAARVNLAYVLIEQRLPAEAEAHLLQAVTDDPSNFDVFFMLGNVTLARGAPEAAIAHFEKAIELEPNAEMAYREACQALVALGRHPRAEAVVRKGLSLVPHSADLHFLLGNLNLHAGRAEGAVACYAQALAVRPDHAETHSNLAMALRSQRQLEAAVASYQRALALRPDAVQPRYDLALILQELGHGTAAVEQLQRVVSLEPGHFDAHLNLGVVLQSRFEIDAAIRSYQIALALKPDSAQTHCNLGIALAAQGKSHEAIEQYERALRCKPEHARSHAALGVEFNQLGRPAEAVTCFRKALELDPEDLESHSSMLFLLSFQDSSARYLEEVRRYGAKVAARAPPLATRATSGPADTPDRWRVGLVSGDLRRHPVALFLESVLAHLDPHRIELFAYVTSAQEDEVTTRLKRHCAGWVSIVGMDDEVAARRIHADGLHVLFDLAGHTAHNRLPVFAWKPAPLQVSWLGYFASTGVPGMDYVLADRVSVPATAELQFTEAVWCMPQSRLCFSAPLAEPALQPSPLPALRNGHITFGSFQALSKLDDAVLRAWSQVLAAVAGSCLRIQSRQLERPEICDELLRRFATLEIPTERVRLVPPAERGRYLAAHAEVDIILDTFPYPGGTTTCEALWMGVPTVTLAGNSMLSRQGASMLASVGLEDWVAGDRADYVARAARHAGDLESLARLRAGLRQRTLDSALFDAARFARDFEQALSGMWNAAGSRSAPSA